MQLGTETGSLINHLMSNRSTHDIVPGVTGATLLSWSDRYPATITDVFVQGAYTYLAVTEDDYNLVEGNMFDGSARYEYFQVPGRTPEYYRFKTDGSSGFQHVEKNKETGRWNKLKYGGLSVGQRDKYYDPSF